MPRYYSPTGLNEANGHFVTCSEKTVVIKLRLMALLALQSCEGGQTIDTDFLIMLAEPECAGCGLSEDRTAMKMPEKRLPNTAGKP